MGRLTNRNREECPYLVEIKCWEDIFWFQVMKAAGIVVEKLLEYRDNGDYFLHEFTLIPSRLLLIMTPASLRLERCVQLIKGGSSSEVHKLRGSRTDMWQSGYSPVSIGSWTSYQAKRQLVIQSPVSERLAEKAELWEWGSASGRYKLDPVPRWLAEEAAK